MTKRNIFEKRKNLKPYEYPELEAYKEAIQHSYWLHTEYNYTSDIQDYKTKVSEKERNAIKNSMLAIAQIEVDVKEFWGDLYKHIPKPEMANVGATFAESECYAEGTEILTPNGFVDFRDIENGDLVAQYHADNTISFVPAKNKLVKSFKGKMHHLTKRHMDVLITPGHNMVVYKTKDAKDFKLIPAEEHSGKNSNDFLPFAAKISGKVDSLSWEDRLRIALACDGNYRYYRNSQGERKPRGRSNGKQEYEIAFKKDKKKKHFKEIIEALENDSNFEFSKYNVSRKDCVRYGVKTDIDYNYKDLEWVDLSDKSWKWAKEFIKEICFWDGTITHRGSYAFSTTNEHNANIVQAVGIAAGYRVTLGLYEDERSDKFNDVYSMVFVENKERVTGTYTKELVDYDGLVYCVEVPTGAIITRRNGRMFIGGNCRHADAYANLLELLGLNEEFERIEEIPALNNRIEYLKKHNEYAKTGSKRDYTIAVLLFSAFIEHISLFSQFLVIMSFNKYKNLFSGMSNAIEATSKEEAIHALFGIDLINTIKEEYPEWFNKDLENKMYAMCKEAFKSEKEVLAWIFEKGELDFLPINIVEEFIKNRINNSLESVGLEKLYNIDQKLIEQTDWFDEALVSTAHVDFFYKR